MVQQMTVNKEGQKERSARAPQVKRVLQTSGIVITGGGRIVRAPAVLLARAKGGKKGSEPQSREPKRS